MRAPCPHRPESLLLLALFRFHAGTAGSDSSITTAVFSSTSEVIHRFPLLIMLYLTDYFFLNATGVQNKVKNIFKGTCMS